MTRLFHPCIRNVRRVWNSVKKPVRSCRDTWDNLFRPCNRRNPDCTADILPTRHLEHNIIDLSEYCDTGTTPPTRAPEKEQVIRRERFTKYKFTWKICWRTLFNTAGLVQIGLFVEEVADITGYAFRHVIIVDGDTIHARRDTRETHSRRDVTVRRIGAEVHTFAGKFVQRT